MALSNMAFEKETFAADVQILKRKPFEAIAMTLLVLVLDRTEGKL